LTRAGVTESPITGMEGNREFLLHLELERLKRPEVTGPDA
jgi:hypothetical protein